MTLRRSVAAIMLAPFLAALTSGCGTIIHGHSQDVLVTSVPSGATAKVGDVQVVTPGTVTLKRKETYTVVFTKEGFPERKTSLESTGSWWLLGNAIFGGVSIAPSPARRWGPSPRPFACTEMARSSDGP